MSHQIIIVDSKNKFTLQAKTRASLLREGIDLRSGMPNYYYTQVDALKSQLLIAAMQDARERAKTLAEGSGVNSGRSVRRVRAFSACALEMQVVFPNRVRIIFPPYLRRLRLW
ncbi:MAG: hypothetical protein OXN25_04080 [Candidatus Poribacteria bacterium]|nr:hypothetical protein [Candidatus Poribacteria bacterium]MYK17415.1 hypothetical protein [Candidatus Poribacteria bacterium]